MDDTSLALLRNDPRIFKLPPYLSFLCVIVGIAWLLILPLDEYCRRTYISENALLPGQVHTYFAGSDQNVFRAYKHEVEALAEESNTIVNDKLEEILRAAGLKVARQAYEYQSSGITYSGENIYAILHAPRGDATEAIVLVSAWKNMDGLLNRSGVPLILTLARYFSRWSLWSKDIIFLITADSRAGPQAWVDAYHDAHSDSRIASLPLKSGALQGAIVIDYPFDHRFESLHIVYDGINGQLPNLDLLNTVTDIASHHMGIRTSLQKMWKHTDSYKDRLHTMLKGMLSQGLGHASGPHSSFIPYHVDAITLQPYGEGWQDEMAMGRIIESTFRSLNNLLEHLHQSFFFYLLMHVERFVSIGTYLPSAMLVAINFSIMAIALWVESGRPAPSEASASITKPDEKQPMEMVDVNGAKALISQGALRTEERDLFLPLAVVLGAQFLGLLPLYVFNHLPEKLLAPTFAVFTALNTILPFAISRLLSTSFRPTTQQYILTKSFSLLLLGMFLSSLATLNFSLSFLIGLLTAPLTYVHPLPRRPILAKGLAILLNGLAPTVVLYVGCLYWGIEVEEVLRDAAFGWDVWGLTTPVVVWCVWWPAWVTASVILLGVPREKSERVSKGGKKVEIKN